MAESNTTFEEMLSRGRKEAARNGGRTKTLVDLAEALHYEIGTHPSHRDGQKVKYVAGMDYIMRGIIALLTVNDGDATVEDAKWVLNNIEIGLKSLQEDLPKIT